MVVRESEGLDLTLGLLLVGGEGPGQGPFLFWVLVYLLHKDRFEPNSDIFFLWLFQGNISSSWTGFSTSFSLQKPA